MVDFIFGRGLRLPVIVDTKAHIYFVSFLRVRVIARWHACAYFMKRKSSIKNFWKMLWNCYLFTSTSFFSKNWLITPIFLFWLSFLDFKIFPTVLQTEKCIAAKLSCIIRSHIESWKIQSVAYISLTLSFTSPSPSASSLLTPSLLLSAIFFCVSCNQFKIINKGSIFWLSILCMLISNNIAQNLFRWLKMLIPFGRLQALSYGLY